MKHRGYKYGAFVLDVNECLADAPQKCDVTEKCVNTLGGYSCLHKTRVYQPHERLEGNRLVQLSYDCVAPRFTVWLTNCDFSDFSKHKLKDTFYYNGGLF